MQGKRQLFLGTFVHSKSRTELEFLHEAVVAVNEQGVIISIDANCKDLSAAAQAAREAAGWDEDSVDTHKCQEGQFFFPGFIGEFNPLDPKLRARGAN
jgi:guanine deaminase